MLAPTARFWPSSWPPCHGMGGNKNVFLCVRLSPIPGRRIWIPRPFGCSIMAAFGRHLYEYAATSTSTASFWSFWPLCFTSPGSGAAFIIPIFIYITLSVFGCYFFALAIALAAVVIFALISYLVYGCVCVCVCAR